MEAQFNDDFMLQADLRQYAALLWRWAWLILLAVVLAAGAAYITSQLMEPVYQATTTLLINEAPSANVSDYTAILTSERLARTYSELLTKRPILDEVLTRLDEMGLSVEFEDVSDLADVISVQLVRDTQLIEVSVEDKDPERAAVIANLLVDVFSQQNEALQTARFAESKASLQEQLTRLNGQIHNTVAAIEELGDDPRQEAERTRLEAELAQFRQTYSELLQSFEQIRVAEAQSTSNVVQVEPAIPPEKPIRPRVLLNTALAAVVGGMLAVGAIFLMEALDDTVKNPEEITRHLGLPVLGTILKHEIEDGSLIALHSPRSPTAEAFRSLRTNIQYTSVDYPVHTLVVTSPDAEVGKTTVSANLGVVLAQGGKRVVIVDADMRRPRQHQRFKLPNRRGLSSFFVYQSLFGDGQPLPEDLLQASQVEGLSVITSGKLPPNPSELLASEKMQSLLNKLSTEVADVVIVDSPPVMAVTDAVVLASKVDGVLLVIKPGETRLETARRSVEQLRRVGANLIGVVLNEVDPKSGRYGYYYRYDQQYYAVDEPVRVGWMDWRKALWGTLGVLVLLVGGWAASAMATGRGLPVWLGGKTPTPTPREVSIVQALTQAAPTEALPVIVYPSATPLPAPATPIPTDGVEETPMHLTAIVEPTATPTLSPPTPGPGLETPFGAQGEYLLHQINFGDSLPKLAAQYQTDRDVIVVANGLVSNQSLQPDQVLVIMPGRTDPLGVERLMVLFLEEDAQVSELASRFSVTPEELRRYNDLGPGDFIPAGRWLIFPKRNITPTPTPTVIPTPDLSYALAGPFGPENAYVLHQVAPGESIPVLEKLYLTSAEVIFAANEIRGSIQVGQVLVILPEHSDPTGVVRFEVYYTPEDIQVEDLATQLGVSSEDLILYNGFQAGAVIPAATWLIYPAP